MKNNAYLNNFADWLMSLKRLSLTNMFVVYNSCIVFKDYINIDDSFFNNLSKKLIDKIEIYSLEKLIHTSREQLIKYTLLSDHHNKLVEFILNWIRYVRQNDLEVELSSLLPYFYMVEQNNSLPLFSDKTILHSEENIKKIYALSLQNIIPKEKNNKLKISDFEFNVLEALMVYRLRKYDIVNASLLFRSLIYLDKANTHVMNSCLNYIKSQQNPLGYFGFYMKEIKNEDEIYTALKVSFECVQTLLEYNYSSFRPDNLVRNKISNIS